MVELPLWRRERAQGRRHEARQRPVHGPVGAKAGGKRSEGWEVKSKGEGRDEGAGQEIGQFKGQGIGRGIGRGKGWWMCGGPEWAEGYDGRERVRRWPHGHRESQRVRRPLLASRLCCYLDHVPLLC